MEAPARNNALNSHCRAGDYSPPAPFFLSLSLFRYVATRATRCCSRRWAPASKPSTIVGSPAANSTQRAASHEPPSRMG
eukprot:5540215-Lingulodinium_polyedra.AAC.1